MKWILQEMQLIHGGQIIYAELQLATVESLSPVTAPKTIHSNYHTRPWITWGLSYILVVMAQFSSRTICATDMLPNPLRSAKNTKPPGLQQLKNFRDTHTRFHKTTFACTFKRKNKGYLGTST
jgi:hypothetical protein